MPASHDFFIATDPTVARGLVGDTLARRGWTVRDTPDFGLTITRGNAVATMLLGALAGPALHLVLSIELFSTQDGFAVARLHRSVGAGAVTGGALGAARALRGFQDAARALHTALSQAGVLTGSVTNARPR